MPNHVYNRLTVVGPARDIATFVVQSQTPTPRTGDLPGSINYTAAPRPARVPFDFHGVVPLPPAYSQVPYSPPGGRGGGHAMQVDTWGVKWGAYDVDTDAIHIDEHRASYTFTTADAPPQRYYEQASMAFPHCIFYVSWGGEGPCLGRAIYHNGQDLGDDTPESDCSEDGEDANDDDAYEARCAAYMAYQTQYLTTHDAWVDARLQATDLDPRCPARPEKEDPCTSW